MRLMGILKFKEDLKMEKLKNKVGRPKLNLDQEKLKKEIYKYQTHKQSGVTTYHIC